MGSKELSEVTKILTEAGLQNSVWGQRILTAIKGTWDADKARIVRGFTLQDYMDAGSWVTCACGKTTTDIPRGDEVNMHIPHDETLVSLGNSFATEVEENKFLLATKTLVEIEERALEVAKEHRLRGTSCDTH